MRSTSFAAAGEEMLSFVQNWFAPRVNPIGIDFGSETLRLAQVQPDGRDYKLSGAASVDVPIHAQTDWEARLDFFCQAVPDLTAQASFRGRDVVLSLPASLMHVRHLRLPVMNESQIKKALVKEAHAAFPFEPEAALMRHMVAGEVRQNLDTLQEVVVIAAPREAVNKYLAAAGRLKLNVVGMKMEPVAVVDCFSHVHRRKVDSEVVSLYVDLGASGTRATIALGTQILFCRCIPCGGDHYNAAVAEAMGVSVEDARLLRLKMAMSEAAHTEARDKRNLTAPQESEVQPEPQHSTLALAVGLTTARLAESLAACCRDHQATFPDKPVQRVIFVGGEARQRSVCTQIARELGLAAQVGDPTVRMARASDISIETGIDRRLPQPAWAIAIGLSFDTHRPAASTAHVAAGAAR